MSVPGGNGAGEPEGQGRVWVGGGAERRCENQRDGDDLQEREGGRMSGIRRSLGSSQSLAQSRLALPGPH